MNSVDFSVIVNMFGMEGMVALGKMKHPVTGEGAHNIEHAKFVIDILSVLQEKTKGNLSDEEHRALDFTLSNLRLNFVQEANASTPSIAENGSEQ